MKSRLLVGIVLLALLAVACDSGDAELTPGSTLITGGSPGSSTTVTTAPEAGSTTLSPPTTLIGQPVGNYEVVRSINHDDGITQHIVVPEGAYTDVDLENFIIDLLESIPQLHGAEVFDSAAAAEAFIVPAESRTDEQNALLERHHFVTLVGRESIEFNGPFSEFPGGAIGS